MVSAGSGGEGGEVTVSWGESFSFTTKIEEWKPEKRLRLAGSGPGDTPIVQQWTIEKRGGTTIEGLEKETEAQMWISTYGLGAEKVKEIEENWKAAFERIFELHVQIQGEKR